MKIDKKLRVEKIRRNSLGPDKVFFHLKSLVESLVGTSIN